MEVSLETTPFLEREAALALGLSIDEVQRYLDNGICRRSSEFVTGFANVLCFPNFYDVVHLGITHCLMPSNRLAQHRSDIGDEVVDALFYFLDSLEAPNTLGAGSCRQFRKYMIDCEKMGFLESYCQLNAQERRVVMNRVIRTCLRTRKYILQKQLTNSSSDDVYRYDALAALEHNQRSRVAEALLSNAHKAMGAQSKPEPCTRIQ